LAFAAIDRTSLEGTFDVDFLLLKYNEKQ